MIFLKKFELNTQYEVAKDGFVYPNVSFVKEDDMLYYELPPIEYEYVNLGLPSGTVWATTNIGARKPEESGLYFQWGDTVGYTKEQISTTATEKDDITKKYFGWKGYKMSSDGTGNATAMTKYNSSDGKDTLELTDDAAHVLMGGDWRIPTRAEFDELRNTAYTTSTWETVNGINGRLFTSKVSGYEGKSVFFPASGYVYNGSLRDEGSCGNYWSSSLAASNVSAWVLRFLSSDVGTGYNRNRYVGVPVRGVQDTPI